MTLDTGGNRCGQIDRTEVGRVMVSTDRDADSQIIGALMIGFAQTARVVSEVLAKAALTDTERETLRTELGAGVTTVAKAIGEVRPGLGEVVLRIYLGQQTPDVTGDAER